MLGIPFNFPSVRHILTLSLLAILINISSIILVAYFLVILAKHPEISQAQYIVCISLVNLFALIGALRTWIVFNTNVSKWIIILKSCLQVVSIFEGFFLLFYMYTEIEYKNNIITALIFESSSFVLETRRYIISSREVIVSQSSRVHPINTVEIRFKSHQGPDTVCPVCLNEQPEHIVLDCKHIICVECVDKLFNSTNKCPCCRKIIHGFQDEHIVVVIQTDSKESDRDDTDRDRDLECNI